MKSRFAVLTSLAYFGPLLFFSLFLFHYLPASVGFWTLSFGWFLVACGTLIVFVAALYYENDLKGRAIVDPKLSEEITALKNQLYEAKKRDPGQDPDLKKRLSDVTAELENARTVGLSLLQEKERLIADLQNTVAKQKKILEEKEALISKFQNKVAELTYEIKAHVSHPEEEQISLSKPLSLQESSLLLKRCITLAQQHTGAWSFNPGMNRSKDLSIDSYALDQRRFFQTLSREKGGLIFIYSPKEEKILYVHPSIKTVLNLSPETFVQEFPKLIDIRFAEVVKKLPTTLQAQIALKMKTQLFNCHLGIIPTGLFKNHVVGTIAY